MNLRRRYFRTRPSWSVLALLVLGVGFLDAHRELAGRPLVAPDGPYPFRASRRNCVFIADDGG
jgi:hypothetical protein